MNLIVRAFSNGYSLYLIPCPLALANNMCRTKRLPANLILGEDRAFVRRDLASVSTGSLWSAVVSSGKPAKELETAKTDQPTMMIQSGSFNIVRCEMSEKTEEQAEARTPIARAALEQAITDAVKASHPDCQNFVGVIVERVSQALPEAANWAVKGIKYGKADRALCGATLSSDVSKRQLEFKLFD
jgi:hypothetical protein